MQDGGIQNVKNTRKFVWKDILGNSCTPSSNDSETSIPCQGPVSQPKKSVNERYEEELKNDWVQFFFNPMSCAERQRQGERARKEFDDRMKANPQELRDLLLGEERFLVTDVQNLILETEDLITDDNREAMVAIIRDLKERYSIV